MGFFIVGAIIMAGVSAGIITNEFGDYCNDVCVQPEEDCKED